MATISVVGDGKRAGPRVDLVSLFPQALCFLRVVLQNLSTVEGVGVASDHRGGEVRCRGAGAVEDGRGDLLAVDCTGDCSAAQLALFTTEVLEALRDGEGLEDGSRLVHGALAQLVVEGCERRVRDSVGHVQVACEQVSVGSVLLCIEDEVDAVVLRSAVAGVLLVWNDDGVLVVVPLSKLVRAVADRVLAVCSEVIECRLVHWVEGGVAQAQREVGFWLGQLDGERLIVHNLQALERLALFEAQDGLEEVGAEHCVLNNLVPGVDEVLGGHRGAVGPLDVIAQGHAVGLFTLQLNGLCHLVVGHAVLVKVDKTRVDHIDDVAAADLIGIAWDERVLRLGAASGDVVAAVCAAGGGAVRATCGHGEG